MGIASGLLRQYAEWGGRGWLKTGGAIFDLGAQQLADGIKPEFINQFVTTFGGKAYAEEEMPKADDYAGHVIERAGFRYASIDIQPLPFSIILDLNRSELPADHVGRYDLVTNHGTSEHILNQWNVFKVAHDAAKPGALMYHAVPMACDFEHGVVSYNPKFFWALAEANGYEVLNFRGWVGDDMAMPDSIVSQLRLKQTPRGNQAWLFVLFRKPAERPFAGLMDPAFK